MCHGFLKRVNTKHCVLDITWNICFVNVLSKIGMHAYKYSNTVLYFHVLHKVIINFYQYKSNNFCIFIVIQGQYFYSSLCIAYLENLSVFVFKDFLDYRMTNLPVISALVNTWLEHWEEEPHPTPRCHCRLRCTAAP